MFGEKACPYNNVLNFVRKGGRFLTAHETGARREAPAGKSIHKPRFITPRKRVFLDYVEIRKIAENDAECRFLPDSASL